MKYNEDNATEIMTNLWLGNKIAAQDFNFITKYNIKFIINVTYEIFNKYDFVDYFNFPLENDLEHKKYFIKIMEDCLNIINYSITNNIPVLVHCKRGHHRSACVVAYFLINYMGWDINQSINFIKNLRPTTFRKNNPMFDSLLISQKIYL